jgi:mannose-6-phosphate isomerase class I
MFRLSCKSQNYDWGKLGSESKVAQLQKEYKDDTPYAEVY